MLADNVELYINGNLVNSLKSYSIRSDLFNACAGFEAECYYEEFSDNEFLKPITYEWYINSVPVQAGYIDKIETTYSKDRHTYMLYGRDMCQVLIDNYILIPKVYENKSIKDIIADIWKTSSSVSSYTGTDGKKVVLSAPLTLPDLQFKYTPSAEAVVAKMAKIKKFRTDYGKTIFDAVAELANMSGLYLYNEAPFSVVRLHTTGIRNTEEGNTPIVSWAPDGTEDGVSYNFVNVALKVPFALSSNILSAKRSRDSSKTFIYNKLIGQTESEMDVYGSLNTTTVKNDRVIESVLKSYKGLKRFKVMDVNSIDYSLWESKKSQIMNNELLQQSRKFESLEYTVAGHSPACSYPEGGNAPYLVNHIANVYDQFYGGILKWRLVYKVEFKGSKDAGRTTVIELCNPSMYEHTEAIDNQVKAHFSTRLDRINSEKTPSHFEKVN